MKLLTANVIQLFLIGTVGAQEVQILGGTTTTKIVNQVNEGVLTSLRLSSCQFFTEIDKKSAQILIQISERRFLTEAFNTTVNEKGECTLRFADGAMLIKNEQLPH